MAHQIALRILVLYCGMSLFGCGKGFGGNPPAVVVALRDKGNIVEYEAYHRSLYIRKVKDLTPLLTCDPTEIDGVCVTDRQFSDLSFFSRLIHLEWVNIQRTSVTDLSHISKFTNLRDLVLSDTRVTDISPLRSLSNLEALSLIRTKIDDLTPLTGLAKLKRIGLAESRVGDLSPLTKLTNLEWLNLRIGTATAKEVAMLRKALPRCEILAD